MSLHSINSEVLPITVADDVYSASAQLLGNKSLVAYWRGAFDPASLENLDSAELAVGTSLTLARPFRRYSLVPIIYGKVLPPDVAYSMFAVHQVTAPDSSKLPLETIPIYPINAIGPRTFHTNFHNVDIPAHHDGMRKNGGLTVHATLAGKFTASFGRPDYRGALQARSRVWPVGTRLSDIGVKDGPAVIHGGPGDMMVFAGYGLNLEERTEPVVHKITSHDVTARQSAVFDPIESATRRETRVLLPIMQRLVDRNPAWAGYPRWQALLS